MIKKWFNLAHHYPELSGYSADFRTINSSKKDKVLKQKMPLSILRQAMNTKDEYINIPEEILDTYQLYRPTPLRRARNLEKKLKANASIFYKYEGVNISGSHKLNSAIAQVYYYKKAGIKHIISGTGAGQWGSALSWACKRMGLKCTIFMPRISYEQKPQRQQLMKLFGANVIPSPSDTTVIGKKYSEKNPNALGSLSIATAEAIEVASASKDSLFAIGSGENHVLLHQTIIGQEAQQQLSDYDINDIDCIIACMGAGSNFAGISFPFLNPKNGNEPTIIAAEPLACPKITKGVYTVAPSDFSEDTGAIKMMTLGTNYEAPGIHAGGLRYHGTSPFVSALYQKKLFSGMAFDQNEVFEAAQIFAENEGVLIAPESAHAVAAAIKYSKDNNNKSILINISGMGYHDMNGYEEYIENKLDSGVLNEEMILNSIKSLQIQ